MKIKFQILDSTNIGVFEDNVYVIGNLPQIGEWNPDKAVQLKRNEDTQNQKMIETVDDIEIDETLIEYKYILKSNGKIMWEGNGNKDNR